MLKQESNNTGSGENNRARACDICRSNACTVYCHADSAYLCTSCDAQVHSANRVASRHKRVRVCESCERAPAAFLCVADDASLCTACDSEVHSANPLARRHHRVPILPISGNSYSSMSTHHQSETTMTDQDKLPIVEQERGVEGGEDAKKVPSWLFTNSNKNKGNHNDNSQNNGFLFSDAYLDLADYNSSMDYQFTSQYNQQQQDCGVPQTSYGGDRVVPLQLEESKGHLHQKGQNFQFDITNGSSGSHYSNKGSLNHNAYISSMETGVVPESTPRVKTASHPRTPKATVDQLPDPPSQMITQLSPMDREARVLRYREKRKTRKFEKTIRYASRKAYAERRLWVNGRFAKRREIEDEDHEFNIMLMYDTGYGVVPSF
ncbi:PREDICTED: zinc finger protein CONSTANS-like [Camelina sativa]|uniref:Zinc finger protein CONSTANS-like n=1 Tax=Camelina sativa TaxID=90675 RepID=A0ABM0T3A3_CAMSA|nr:PREDICTED: zinc finger protein CONSTANS-like [Camelina sativa]